VSKIRVTKDKTVSLSMGQEQNMPDKMHNALQSALLIFPELGYGQNTKLALDGIKTVNGKDAYKVIIEQNGDEVIEYFDIVSGLKVRTESPVIGEVEYANYRDYGGGIQFPSLLMVKTPQLPMVLKTEVTAFEVNPVIEESELK